MALALPADGVRHLAADASLLAEYDAAAIAPQPRDRHRNQFRVSHMVRKNPQESFEGERHSEKCQSSFERGGKIGKKQNQGQDLFLFFLPPVTFAVPAFPPVTLSLITASRYARNPFIHR